MYDPSVGTVTAVTFVAMVDEVARFETAKQVRAYFGLVPREMSSGEKRSTADASPKLETHECATCLWKPRGDSALRARRDTRTA
ncbi:MAG: IS110 family transposase [Sandaracinaceae bacterium]|nr:IS110 family transposase [Sandaracinaceae bacterium]